MTKKIVVKEETSVNVRPLEVIAIEIRSIDTQARKVVLDSAIEIGKRLTEAKALVAHGEWGGWLEGNVSYSQSTANNFMRVASEYGANSQTFGNLSYSQAVALLAVPADEREAFVEENNAEDMSARELQAAIKEKQEAERLLEESRGREEEERFARLELESSMKALKDQQEERNELVSKLNADLEAAKEEAEKAGTKPDPKLKVELRKAEKAVAEAEKRIADLEADMQAKIKAREDELAAESARALSQSEEAATKQLSELQEQLRKNNNVAAIKVKVHFEALVGTFKELLASVAELENEEQKKAIQGRIASLCDEMKVGLS